MGDDELLRRACTAENGDKFSRLWNGGNTCYPSPSEADLALCGLLAFWCGPDAARIDRLFRRSKRFRSKWDERHGGNTYGAMTIAKALEGKSDFYTPPDDKPKAAKPAAVDVLVEIGLQSELWHDSAHAAYATLGRRTVKVTSQLFRHQLVNQYRKRTGKVPAADAKTNAIAALEAAAIFDGPECVPHVRVAQHGQRVYLHLADCDDTVIEVSADGWGMCNGPPVRFVRSAAMFPLPVPQRGGSLDELRRYVNVRDDDTWALIKAWLAASIGTGGPFPLAVLNGGHGTAKTTTGKLLQALIDPNATVLACEPRDTRDMMIAARRAWLLAYDNLSHLSADLSDALCRLATGGGFSTR